MDFISDANSGRRREVFLDDVKQFARNHEIDENNIFETSAKDGINVSAVFEKAALISLSAIKEDNEDEKGPDGKIQINQKQDSIKGKGCC